LEVKALQSLKISRIKSCLDPTWFIRLFNVLVFTLRKVKKKYNFRENSLPIMLALQGYDVWIGNNRGTVFSDKNSHLPNYWDFSMDHFAKYDQPALINKVL